MIWVAVLLALGSAISAALSTSVQHQAAEEAPASAAGVGLFTHLLRRPVWWLGQGLGMVGLVCHAAALGFGPITLVQPIAIMGMVFAPPIRAAMSRRWLPRREAIAVGVTFAGLLAFLLATAPQESEVSSGAGIAGIVVAFVVVSGVLVVMSNRFTDSGVQGFLLGCASGLLFGSMAVCLKFAMHELDVGGISGFLSSPATYAVVVLGVSGVLLNQLAYRRARLSASMPALNIVNVLVALTVGYLLLGDVPRHTPLALVISAIGAMAIAWGLFTLARIEEEVVEQEELSAGRPGATTSPGRG